MSKKLIMGVLVGMGMLATSLSAAASDNLFKNYVLWCSA